MIWNPHFIIIMTIVRRFETVDSKAILQKKAGVHFSCVVSIWKSGNFQKVFGELV